MNMSMMKNLSVIYPIPVPILHQEAEEHVVYEKRKEIFVLNKGMSLEKKQAARNVPLAQKTTFPTVLYLKTFTSETGPR